VTESFSHLSPGRENLAANAPHSKLAHKLMEYMPTQHKEAVQGGVVGGIVGSILEKAFLRVYLGASSGVIALHDTLVMADV
jgi:hypothetical protein